MNANAPQWRKSSYSGGSNGSCVEVDDANPGRVRDSKDPHGPTLTFTPTAWQTFITSVRTGDFSSL
ncbi:hypothetical protein P3T36_006821 [Kitasatospora sp. MAP12-15]|uniref:DUF397 domain-containing protein n=1 Tax=unclassified Kitasatospora TaxID=2633591 RepID=UPI0024742366|nr:DUF397 domain-containing protein [Kitasatospora sp. MAP12-44]MDH6112152.1 hypothetical protein [Kitasatospora sp. MAP12-44]